MNGAEFIVRSLIAAGHDTVFGYPGGTVLSLYDSLYRHRKEIRHVRTAHEQGAAHAADGYARMSGKPGICIATSGPGATNLITGIANAFMDSVPVIFITGNVEHFLIGTDSFQEVDIVGMTLGVTKQSWAIRTPEMLVRAINSAAAIALSGRRGPVLIDIPKDILEKNNKAYDCLFSPLSATGDRPSFSRSVPVPADSFFAPAATGDRPSFRELSVLVGQAKKPLIICGGGVKSAGAGEELKKYASLIGAPICETLMGIGAVDRSFPLNFGLLGSMASDDAKKAFEESDLMISVGARLSNRVIDAGKLEDGKTKLIQIDADRAEINKIVRADAYIAADAKAALRGILAHSEGIVARKPWITRKTAPPPVDPFSPQQIFDAVRRAAPEKITVCTDVGLHQMFTAKYFAFREDDRFITSGGLGTMGFGLGAAIGAQIAAPDRPTVLITGDGSFMMNMNELTTVAAQKLTPVIIVMRNNQLGMVREMQRQQCGRRYSQTLIRQKINIPKLAASLGIRGVRADDEKTLEYEVRQALEGRYAVVIEVRTKKRGA